MQHRKREIPEPTKREKDHRWTARIRVHSQTREKRFDTYHEAKRWIITQLISQQKELLMWLESELRDL